VQLFSQDEEKYAVWEKERMPQLLLQIEASSKKSNKKQKKWARKAMVKSEIEVSTRHITCCHLVLILVLRGTTTST
jgi:hypothetical protein